MLFGNKMLRLVVKLVVVVFALLWLPAFPAHAAGVKWLDTPNTATGFSQATRPGALKFPRDLGAHPDFKTEWWYYTGNLQTAEGREFGMELTFFRQALLPQPAQVGTGSQWRSPQVYSGHFAISDIASHQFYFQDRFSRNAIALAGATSQPYRVWLEDWSAMAEDNQEGNKTVHLQATMPEGAIDLTLNQAHPPVLQGDRGLSIKGAGEGNASYYYSIVQQPTQGTITVKGETYQVTGISWKDHEYSTSSLDPGTIGWNWFSAQFENGTALMLYVLRREDGAIAPQSAGTYITAQGKTQSLTADDFAIMPQETWTSPATQAKYPIQWQVMIPSLDMSLQATALMPNQELNTATAKYWEGAVKYNGKQGEQAIAGRGYVELTGYANRLDAILGS
jgi:predicted secreted hydrolase